MNFVDNFMEKWNALVHRVGPFFARAKEIWKTVSDKVSFVFRYILKCHHERVGDKRQIYYNSAISFR